MLLLVGRVVRFKGFRTVTSFHDSRFNIIDETIRSSWISQPAGDILHDFIKIILRKRKCAQVAELSVYGHASSSGQKSHRRNSGYPRDRQSDSLHPAPSPHHLSSLYTQTEQHLRIIAVCLHFYIPICAGAMRLNGCLE